MAAHGLFGKRAGAFRDEMAVFQSDALLVPTGIADDGGRDLRIVGLDDTDAICGQVLMGDLKGRVLRDCLDHVRGQQSKPLGATRNFVSHLNRGTLPQPSRTVAQCDEGLEFCQALKGFVLSSFYQTA